MASSYETVPTVELTHKDTTSTRNDGALAVTVLEPDNDIDKQSECSIECFEGKKLLKGDEPTVTDDNKSKVSKDVTDCDKGFESDETSILQVINSPAQGGNSLNETGLEPDEQIASEEQEECDSDEEARIDVNIRIIYSSDYQGGLEPEPSVPGEKSAPEESIQVHVNGGNEDEENTLEFNYNPLPSITNCNLEQNEQYDGNMLDKLEVDGKCSQDEAKKETNYNDVSTNGSNLEGTHKEKENKIQDYIAKIVDNVKVAYKVYKGNSCNATLQTIFLITLVSQAFVQERCPYAGLFAVNNDTFAVQENVVFAIRFDNGIPLGFTLPEPNLPSIMNNTNLGINMRQGIANTPTTGNSVQHQISIWNNFGNMQGHNSDTSQSTNQQLGSSSGFINVSSAPPLSLSVREGEGNLRGETNRRVVDVPMMPSTHSLGLDEGNTDTKAPVEINENINNLIDTGICQDGGQTTVPDTLRNRIEVQTVGSYSFETLPGIARHFSHSTEPVPEDNRDLVSEEERMTDVQARARTFDVRWPHSHLDPMDMANAGFYFAGRGDIVRCHCCGKLITQWEIDDDPFIEHRRYSPECEYIQNQELVNPQHFGASGYTEATMDDLILAEDEQDITSGEHNFRYRPQDLQNGRQGLEMGGYSEGPSRQMFPRPEQDHSDERFRSEIIPVISAEPQYSGVQESGDAPSHTGLTMFPVLDSEAPENISDLATLDSIDGHEIDGHNHPDAIDQRLVASYLYSNEVRMVILEGYIQTDIERAIVSIVRGDGIITVRSLKQMLNYMGVKMP